MNTPGIGNAISRAALTLLLSAALPCLGLGGVSAQFSAIDDERRDFRALFSDILEDTSSLDIVFVDGNAVVTDRRLALRLLELIEGSETFERHWSSIADSSVPVYLGTYESFGIETRSPSSGRTHFVPDSDREGWIRGAFVIVNSSFIEAEYMKLLDLESPPAASVIDQLIRWEVVSTLGHELAHVYDVARDEGRWEHFCRDPLPGESVVDSCAVRRENIYRGELGIPLTRYYGMIPPEEALDIYLERAATPVG